MEFESQWNQCVSKCVLDCRHRRQGWVECLSSIKWYLDSSVLISRSLKDIVCYLNCNVDRNELILPSKNRCKWLMCIPISFRIFIQNYSQTVLSWLMNHLWVETNMCTIPSYLILHTETYPAQALLLYCWKWHQKGRSKKMSNISLWKDAVIFPGIMKLFYILQYFVLCPAVTSVFCVKKKKGVRSIIEGSQTAWTSKTGKQQGHYWIL